MTQLFETRNVTVNIKPIGMLRDMDGSAYDVVVHCAESNAEIDTATLNKGLVIGFQVPTSCPNGHHCTVNFQDLENPARAR